MKVILEKENYKAEVEIKDELEWGEQLEIQKETYKAIQGDTSAMIEAKYKALEFAIVSIVENGKVVPFSRDWMNKLPASFGNKIYDAVDKMKGDKKKD